MAVSYAPWNSLPCQLPHVPANFKAVTVMFRFLVVTHKAEERYIDWSHSKLKSLEMQAEVLAEATKNLVHRHYT